MRKSKHPTAEYLRQCFREESGKLFWLERPREHFLTNGAFKGFNSNWPSKEAGCQLRFKNSKGEHTETRWVLHLDTVCLYRHRIIWCMHYEAWPERIDHRDGNSLNDQIQNLRICNPSQNSANCKRPSVNKSGYKGVFFYRNKWRATMTANGKTIFLGDFTDPVTAHAAYLKAAQQHFGEFARAE